MTSLESIEKLRNRVNPMMPLNAEIIASEIEREIAEKYMELPVDADGVPIHIGDEMMQNDKRIGSVTAVGFHTEPRVWVLPHGCYVSIVYTARGIVHYKPRTVEDVLEDVLHDSYTMGASEVVVKYAAELRMREAE